MISSFAAVTFSQPSINWSGQLQFADIQPGLQWPAAQGNVSGKLATSGGLTKQGGWFVKLPQLAVNGTIMKQALTLVGKLDASDINGKGDLLQVNTPGLTLKHGPNGMMVKGQLDKTWNMVANIDAPN